MCALTSIRVQMGASHVLAPGKSHNRKSQVLGLYVDDLRVYQDLIQYSEQFYRIQLTSWS